METNKEYVFETKDWIKLDGVNDFWKEFPVKSDKPEEQKEEISYYVEAYTGDMDEAGTEANVYIQLYGDKGDSGPRRLLQSKSNDNKFEKGKCDEFEIKAVDLGNLRKIKVGHDGDEPGSGWFLQKVQVRTSENENKIFVFVCNK
ncbi:hypothetical protein KUTeg_016687 [Tegillarca granosa]|uniref:PLAT domain-containing protein n=1 Tax=Tegillarca granosa TaxID=220873 RepID=A0ABQ9ELK4_TEGGR|nr:hypothetical protein KUTeg_016687 [Tegillarca granosa]